VNKKETSRYPEAPPDTRELRHGSYTDNYPRNFEKLVATKNKRLKTSHFVFGKVQTPRA
jgi:hypothetical protein